MDYRLAALNGLFLVLGIWHRPALSQAAPSVSLSPLPVDSSASILSGPILMEQIVGRISQHASVSAKVRHRCELFGQKLVGTGSYMQSRDQQRLQVRFSLGFKTADRMVSLLHVSDGRTLWMFDNLEGRPSLSRVDLLRLRQAAVEKQRPVSSLMLSGGLPQLLANLQSNLLAAQPRAVIFQDVPVWAVALRWDAKRLAALLKVPELVDAQGGIRSELLPEQFPDRVLLLVGQDDLFPYHLDFRRSSPDGESLLPGAGSVSLATMELFEVQFNAELDPMLFVYQSGNLELDDRTDEYLKDLHPTESRR